MLSCIQKYIAMPLISRYALTNSKTQNYYQSFHNSQVADRNKSEFAFIFTKRGHLYGQVYNDEKHDVQLLSHTCTNTIVQGSRGLSFQLGKAERRKFFYKAIIASAFSAKLSLLQPILLMSFFFQPYCELEFRTELYKQQNLRTEKSVTKTESNDISFFIKAHKNRAQVEQEAS